MKPLYHPSPEKFAALFERGNVIPVYRQLMSDTLTPVLAFRKIAAGPYGFLLESASGSEEKDRYSFVGTSPFALFKSEGRKVTIEEDGEVRTWTAENPLDEFQRYLEQFTFVPMDGLPRFSCGAVGYMGYDVVRFVENLPHCPPDDRGLPDMFFMFFDQVLIFDRFNKTLKVLCSQRVDGRDPAEAYEAAKHSIDRTIEALRSPSSSVVSVQLRAPGLPESRREGQGVHPRRRHLPGRSVPAAHGADERGPS